MPPLDFPNSPVAGTTFFGGLGAWIYDGAKWNPQAATGSGGGTSVTVGTTPPPSPAQGSLWWDTIGGQLYISFTDINSTQWVDTNSGGGALYQAGPGLTINSATTPQTIDVVTPYVAISGSTMTGPLTTTALTSNNSITAPSWVITGTDLYIYNAGSGDIGFRTGVSGTDSYFAMRHNGEFDCTSLAVSGNVTLGHTLYFNGATGSAGPNIYGDSANVGFALPTGSGGFYFYGGTGSQILLLSTNGNATFSGSVFTGGSVQLGNGGDLFLARTDQAFGWIVRPNTTGYKSLGFAVQGTGTQLDFVQISALCTWAYGGLRVGTLNLGQNATWAGVNSAFNTLAGSGCIGIGWNFTNGNGETDFFINRNGGGGGGLFIYDFPNTSGTMVLMASFTTANATFSANVMSEPAANLDANLIANATATSGGHNWIFSSKGGSAPIGAILIYDGTANATRISIDASGNCAASSAWGSVSDASLKTDIEDHPHGLAEILKVRPRRFRYTADNMPERGQGFIAQELAEIMPELIGEMTLDNSGTMVKTVTETGLIGPLVNAIKELAAQNAKLEARLAQLEGAR